MKIQLSDHFTYKKLIKFTISSIIMMIFTSIYCVIDGVFVSNFVGADAFASVNIIYPFIAIIGSVGFMFGTGGSAFVSKTMGEGENEKANKYFSMLIYFMFLIGIVLTVLGFIFIEPIAKLLGADANSLEGCLIYGRVMICGILHFMLQYSFQSFLVVAEKPILGLIISILSGVFNMLGDFLFIYVFKLGVMGAGVASVLSQCIGGIVPLIYFLNKKRKLHLTKTNFNWKVIVKSCSNGLSEMLTNISLSVITIFYNLQLLKIIGSDGVVIYGIIQYIGFIFAAIFLGYSIGVAPIISYHYGAKNKEELKNLLRKSIIMTGISGILMTTLAEILARVFANIFVSYDNNLVEKTIIAIRLYSLSFILNGLNIFASSFFTALNNGVVSAIISFLRTFAFQILMIYLLPIILGINGIWLAVVVSEVLSIIVVVFFILKNKKRYGYI